jgi:hypothetical protein
LPLAQVDTNPSQERAGGVVSLAVDPAAARVAAVVIVVAAVDIDAGWVGNEDRPAAEPIAARPSPPIVAIVVLAG